MTERDFETIWLAILSLNCACWALIFLGATAERADQPLWLFALRAAGTCFLLYQTVTRIWRGRTA